MDHLSQELVVAVAEDFLPLVVQEDQVEVVMVELGLMVQVVHNQELLEQRTQVVAQVVMVETELVV
jgi:hypothetical protein